MENDLTKLSATAISIVDEFRTHLGPFVAAAEATRMPMIFTDGLETSNPVVFANNAFLDMTGFSQEEILGAPLVRLLSHISDAGTIADMIAEMSGGRSGTWDVPLRHRDGSEFLAAAFLAPVTDESGEIQQHFLSFCKLGGHIERLIHQRNELHTLYEMAPGFIATSVGPDHRFTFANAAYKRFVGRDDLVGLTVAKALPEIVSQGFTSLLDNVFETGVPYHGKCVPIVVTDQDTGEERSLFCDFVYQPVRDANEKIVGLFCEGFDVTEQKASADTLAALQSELIHISRVNAMGTMAITLAHELNQPLGAIENYTVAARRSLLCDTPNFNRSIESLEGISEATARASDMIRNLRSLVAKSIPTRDEFELNAAVGECVRLVEAGGDLGVRIDNDISLDIKVCADRIQIQQVIINLLKNACEAVAGSDRMKVGITAEVKDDKTIVSVTDTGNGVAREIVPNLFRWGESNKSGGMGLGLSICQTILEAHGGKVWLGKSDRSGSTFSFSIGDQA